MPASIDQIFRNYEQIKLAVANPDIVNSIIFLLFALTALLSLKKDKIFADRPLGRAQSDQLKGVAIFLVIAGHLWVHVADRLPFIVLSGDGVALFLLLSGYGLSLSWDSRPQVTLWGFFKKRLKRVMIPYWIVTAIILLLDWALLQRRLGLGQIILTTLGINLTTTLTHLDYVRWFVTFILLWYILFYLARRHLRPPGAAGGLLLCALPLLPLNYYVLHFEWYQFFAFPSGCLVAVYRDPLLAFYQRRKRLFVALALSTVGIIMLCKAAMRSETIHMVLLTRFPNIALAYFNDGVSVILAGAALLLIVRISESGYYSRLLVLGGRYSYELFLLHGLFLIKYDPIIRSSTTPVLVGEFVLYMLLLALPAYLLAKTTAAINAAQRT